MEIVKMADFGNAAEVFVDGVGAIDFIGQTVRIGYFAKYPQSSNRLVVSTRWSLDTWLGAGQIYNTARAIRMTTNSHSLLMDRIGGRAN